MQPPVSQTFRPSLRRMLITQLVSWTVLGALISFVLWLNGQSFWSTAVCCLLAAGGCILFAAPAVLRIRIAFDEGLMYVTKWGPYLLPRTDWYDLRGVTVGGFLEEQHPREQVVELELDMGHGEILELRAGRFTPWKAEDLKAIAGAIRSQRSGLIS